MKVNTCFNMNIMESYETPDEELEPEEIELRNICRRLTDEEFFSITPIWCTSIDDLQLPYSHPKFSGDIYIDCDVKKLIQVTVNLGNVHFSREFNGPWWEDERFCHTLIDRWQKGLGVDPPEVNFVDGGTSIGNGRHRTILACELHVERIVVRIKPNCLRNAEELLDAVKIDL